MVKGLIDQTEMLVDMWQPGICHVADVALLVGNEVSIVLTCRRIAVMAGRTGTQHLRMVDYRYGRPGRRGVAVLTHICRRHVCRVFAGRVGAVVAADAVARDIHVIEIRRDPGDGCMAVVAVVAACDVRRVLARGGVAVVTGEAGPEDLRVVDNIGR